MELKVIHNKAVKNGKPMEWHSFVSEVTLGNKVYEVKLSPSDKISKDLLIDKATELGEVEERDNGTFND